MARRRRWSLVAIVTATVVTVTGVSVAVAATADESGSLAAKFQQSSSWGSGYEATYTISNVGAATVDGWRLEFDLPASATVSSFWETSIVRNGDRYLATNKAYNGSLAAGATTSFGFIVLGTGVPRSCVVNDAPCGSGGVVPSPTASSPVPSSPVPSSVPPTSKSPTATSSPVPSGTVEPTSTPLAPYVDMGAWPTPDLSAIVGNTGLKGVTLGFVTGAGCKASWFGAYDPRTGWAKDQMDAVRAKGASVKVSFGGATGVELAQGCGDVASLAAEYQAVVDAYRLTAIDLDIEGAATADKASVDRRSKAIAQLQKSRPGLKVSYTLPVLPEGLTADGIGVLRSAVDAGVAIDLVNVMAMDYYRDGSYGDFAVQAAQSTFSQLRSLYPGASDSTLWRRIGVTPMLGKNDDGRVFDQTAAQQLVTFARDKHLGMLAFWELTRDGNACNGALYKCTNISQQPYEFSRIFAGYAG